MANNWQGIFRGRIVIGGLATLLICSVVSTSALAQSYLRSRGRAASVSYTSNRSGLLADFSIFYGQDEATANPSAGNEYKDNESIYDIKLGYVFANDFYLGGLYAVRNYSYQTGSYAGQATGVGLGYFLGNGFNLRSFYRFGETFGDYKDGTGYQVDLAYLTNLSANSYLGFTMSHRQVTYKTNATIAGFDKYTHKSTFPMIALGFLLR
jgi:hypothetical protein